MLLGRFKNPKEVQETKNTVTELMNEFDELDTDKRISKLEEMSIQIFQSEQ
jgi:hypothetical protein